MNYRAVFDRYGVALGAVLLAAALRLTLNPWMTPGVPFLTFFLAVMIAAWYGGLGPGLLASFLSVLVADFLFIEPMYSLTFSLNHVVSLFVFGVEAVAITMLTEQSRRAEGRFAKFMHHLPGLAWIKDATGRYVFINEAAERAFNIKKEQLYGKTDEQVFPPFTAHQFKSNDAKVRASGTSVQTIETLEQQDGWHDSVVHKFPIPTSKDGSVMVAGIAIDITEYRRAELVLRESEARFRTMADTAPVLIWMSDKTKLWTWVNKPWLDFTGRTMEQSLGKGWSELVHPGDLDYCSNKYTLSFDQRHPFKMEYRLRRYDGQYRWILDHGVPRFTEGGDFLGYIGSCIDVTERRLAEDALREREHGLDAILKETPFLLTRCSRDLRYQFASRAYADMIGRKPEDIVGKSIMEIMGRSGFGTIFPHILKVLQGHQVEYESDVHFEGIGTRSLHVVYMPEKDSRGEVAGWVASILDLTGRKEAEKALQISNARLAEEAAALMKLNQLSSRLWQKETLREGLEEMLDATIQLLSADMGNVQIINEKQKLTIVAHRGFDQDFLKFFREVSLTDVSCSARALRSGLRIIIEDVEKDPDFAPLRDVARHAGYRAVQSTPLIAHNGEPLGMLSTHWHLPHRPGEQELRRLDLYIRQVVDFIERLRAEEALRKSEEAVQEHAERLQLAMTGAQMGAWDIDLQTQKVVWDAKQYEIFGRGIGEAPANMDEFYKLVHPDDVSHVKEAAAATMRTGRFSEEFRIIRPDGSLRWIKGEGALVLDQQGQSVRMVGVNYDITEQRESQARMARFTEELELKVTERTNELVQSQEQLRALASELNLTEQRERKRLAVYLHDHLAQMLALCRLKLHQAKRVIGHDGLSFVNQADAVLDEALAYTRTLVADLAPPVLYDLGLPAALKWLSKYMNRYEMSITVSVPEDKNVKVSEEQAVLLFQSVRELLMNSYKHGSTGEASVTLTQHDNMLRIDVRDYGKGFEPNVESQMPTKFGLFSIRERMKALGGSFLIESSPGQGTAATLILPLQDTSAPASETLEETDHGPSLLPDTQREVTACAHIHHKGLIRVLLVDDHAMVRQGLRSVLEGYSDVEIVGEAADGIEAIAGVPKWQPAVVIMDINMPNMNGVEATSIIKTHYPDTIIIGLSVQSTEQTKTAMIQAGASSFLTKEAAVDKLYEAIRTALTQTKLGVST